MQRKRQMPHKEDSFRMMTGSGSGFIKKCPENAYQRTIRLFGKEAVDALFSKRVAVFGLGGVGGSAVEALARSNIGTIDVIDNDFYNETNLNRQCMALIPNLGRRKTDVCEERIHDINPEIRVMKHPIFYLPGSEEANGLELQNYDYILDAIDTVSAKIGLILEAQKAQVPIISCMGAGNKMDPSKLQICDLFETSMDPLARIMRRELRKRGVQHLKVVYSTEPSMKPLPEKREEVNERSAEKEESEKRNLPLRRQKDTPASCAFVPPAAGLLAASVVVRELMKSSEVQWG